MNLSKALLLQPGVPARMGIFVLSLEPALGYRLTLATGYDTNARLELGSAQLICQ